MNKYRGAAMSFRSSLTRWKKSPCRFQIRMIFYFKIISYFLAGMKNCSVNVIFFKVHLRGCTHLTADVTTGRMNEWMKCDMNPLELQSGVTGGGALQVWGDSPKDAIKLHSGKCLQEIYQSTWIQLWDTCLLQTFRLFIFREVATIKCFHCTFLQIFQVSYVSR